MFCKGGVAVLRLTSDAALLDDIARQIITSLYRFITKPCGPVYHLFDLSHVRHMLPSLEDP